MSSNSSNFVSCALKYGIVLGLLNVAYSMLLYIFGIDMFNIAMSAVSFVVGAALYVIIFVLGTKYYRVKFNSGALSYGQAFLMCLLISVFASLIQALYNYVFLEFIDPAYLADSVAKFMEQMADKGMPDEQLDMINEKMQETASKTSFRFALDAILGAVVLGTIIALIVSIFTKRKPEDNPFDGEMEQA